jgi:hypothetical protein
MNQTKELVCMVVDTGYYLDVAVHIIPEFKKVKYFCVPAETAFESPNMAFIGHGIEGLEVVHDFFDAMGDVDLFVFPDSHYMGWQEYLRSIGKVVFGTAKGAEIEHYRWTTRGFLEKLGLPTVPAVRVCGIDELREYLRDKENKWIKISTYRGLMETFHFYNYQMADPFFTELEYKLGPLKNLMYFIIEDDMPGIECGADDFVIGDKFPSVCHIGYEIKDAGYLGYVTDKKPDILTQATSKLKEFFKKVFARGGYSNEIRIDKDGTGYLIDPTPRLPSPPHATIMTNIEGFGNMLWEIANGIVPQIKTKHKFVAELMLYTDEAKEEWVPVLVPDEVKEYVHFKYALRVDNMWYSVPNVYKQDIIGSVVAGADTLEEAIELVKKRADMIKAEGLHYNIASLDKALSEISKGEKYGIKFE